MCFCNYHTTITRRSHLSLSSSCRAPRRFYLPRCSNGTLTCTESTCVTQEQYSPFWFDNNEPVYHQGYVTGSSSLYQCANGWQKYTVNIHTKYNWLICQGDTACDLYACPLSLARTRASCGARVKSRYSPNGVIATWGRFREKKIKSTGRSVSRKPRQQNEKEKQQTRTSLASSDMQKHGGNVAISSLKRLDGKTKISPAVSRSMSLWNILTTETYTKS